MVGNTPEFGTVASEQGFRNLYAMDSVIHVKKGKHYPPIMITTGLNDSRVASWEPAKLVASLRASNTTSPVFLRVEEKAGHGIGSTKSQSDELYADVITFIKWRSGDAGWAPAVPVVSKRPPFLGNSSKLDLRLPSYGRDRATRFLLHAISSASASARVATR